MATVEPQLMTTAPRGVPVEWPCNFDGNEPLPWIDRIERVFCRLGIIDPYRVKIASIFFDGPVVPWFQELQQSGFVTSWELLKNAILAAAREETFQLKTQKDVVIDDRKESDMSIEMALESEDAPQVFAEMPQRIIDVAWPIPTTAGDALELFAEMPESDKATEDMVEEIAASDEPDSKQFHQTAPDGIEERDIHFINLPKSLPQEGEVQENLEMAKLMNENVHLTPVIDDLKIKTLAAEFATVRHQIEVLEDSIEEMVQPVNFVAILTTSHRPDHIVLIPAGPLNREEQIWASTDDADWRLSSDSGLWHCIQTLELRSSFAPTGFSVNVATTNAIQVLLATSGGHLVYLEIGIGKFSEVNHTQLEYELSCLDINPIRDNSSYSSLVAVVMWTGVSGTMLSLPGLDLVTKECMGGEIISCSVLLCTFEGIPYLLCALGDGHLFNFQLNAWICGCVQRTLLQCDDINPSSIGEKDRFPEMPNMILPENNQSMEVHSAGECLLICLQNCSCVAYLYSNRCLIWFGDRMNAKEPTHVQGSQQPSSALYLRLAASEFPTCRRTKINVLVVFVIALVGTIISSVVLVLISRRRRMYMIRKLDAIQGLLLSFPYTQLQNTIGIGGFGSVFKGTLSDSSVVGVTKLEGLRQREEVVRPAEQVIMVGYWLAMKGVSLLLMNTLPNTKEELMNIVAAKFGIHARNEVVTNEEGAYELVMTMQAGKNAGVCGDLLGGCVYTKSVSNGTFWQIFPFIGSSYIIDPASEHYAAMIEVLSYWGCFDEAEKLIHNKPFKPNALIWRALLDSFKPKTVQSFYARDRSHPRSKDIYRGLVVLTLDCINAGQATDPSFVLHDVGEYQKDFIYYHCATLAVTYVHFDLEDKVKFDGRGNVTIYWDMFLNVSQSRGKADWADDTKEGHSRQRSFIEELSPGNPNPHRGEGEAPGRARYFTGVAARRRISLPFILPIF